MAPDVQRTDPPYLQIAAHIRQQILSGELADGDAVPSIRQIMQQWNVAMATATKAVATLRAEGYVRAVPGIGTVVSAAETIGYAPRDRMLAIRRTGRIYPPGEHAKITSAELVTAPAEIADALSLAAGTQVIRRHRVTLRGDTPVSASTSWFDGQLAGAAPLLLETRRIPRGTPGYIEDVTGRTAVKGRDQMTADAASEDEAAELGIAAGSPVMRGRNWVYDSSGGVIEYGEYVTIAAGRWASYDYEL